MEKRYEYVMLEGKKQSGKKCTGLALKKVLENFFAEDDAGAILIVKKENEIKDIENKKSANSKKGDTVSNNTDLSI